MVGRQLQKEMEGISDETSLLIEAKLSEFQDVQDLKKNKKQILWVDKKHKKAIILFAFELTAMGT